MTGRYIHIVFLALLFGRTGAQDNNYFTTSGSISFTSDAPLEVIKASSDHLDGVLNLDSREFLFNIAMNSFEGFNSSLQRTHFNENYLETEKYPKSSFAGKIIEEVDFHKMGKVRVRAKGKLLIHGVEQDRIIRCELDISRDKIDISSDFTVLLAEHDIKIPSIVQQKIAEEIDVRMRATISPMK